MALVRAVFTPLDRVGASSLPEDLEGASYWNVCHLEETAGWADRVDVAKLPPGGGEARRLGIAKVEVMGRRRAELVAALDAAFPDVPVPDPRVPGATVGLHAALTSMLQSIVPLYESNPLSTAADAPPVLPQTTRALARLLDALASSDEARAALARIGGRSGYRPLRAALGVVRPTLAYPELRSFVQSALGVVGPGGAGEAELQALLDVVQRELGSLTPDPPLAPWKLDDPSAAQPNRPRTNYEFLRELLLAEGDAFAAPGDPPRWIAARDARGNGFSSRLVSIDITGFNERVIATPTDASDPAWSPLLQ
jgi:hypothetical protein